MEIAHLSRASERQREREREKSRIFVSPFAPREGSTGRGCVAGWIGQRDCQISENSRFGPGPRYDSPWSLLLPSFQIGGGALQARKDLEKSEREKCFWIEFRKLQIRRSWRKLGFFYPIERRNRIRGETSAALLRKGRWYRRDEIPMRPPLANPSTPYALPALFPLSQ